MKAIIIVSFVAALISCQQAASQPVEYRIVAVSDEQAFGMPLGVTYSGFHNPHIFEDGQVAFSANLEGPGVTADNRSVIYRETDSEWEIVARTGDAAPGIDPAVAFSSFYFFDYAGRTAPRPLTNLAGQVSYMGRIDEIDQTGIWSNSAGDGYKKVFLRGDIAPGTNDTFSDLRYGSLLHWLGNGGHIAIRGEINGPHLEDTGIWVTDENAENPVLVAIQGEQAPGFAPGIKFNNFGEPELNSSGTVVFHSTISGTGITEQDDEVMWAWTPQTGPEVIVREGDSVLGFPITVVFTSVKARINDLGHTLIWGDIDGPGITYDSDQVIFSDRDGNGLELVYREGIQAPMLTPGVKLINLAGSVFFNNSSQIGFFAGLEGPGITSNNGSGFWSEAGPHDLNLVARKGQHVPGFSDDYTLESFSVTYSSQSRGPEPTFNEAGRLTFVGTLDGPNPNPNNQIVSQWISDPVGELRTVSTPGALINVSTDPADSDLREVTGSSFGTMQAANTNDEIAIVLGFTDETYAVAVVSYADGCVADVNGDGIASPADFTAWIEAYNSNTPGCDQNNDGLCSPADFTAWISNYTIGC